MIEECVRAVKGTVLLLHCQKVRIELVEPSKSVWGFDTFIVDIYWLLVIDIQNKSDWNVKLFF